MLSVQRQIERFWDNVVKTENGCWLWQGKSEVNGYGYARFGMRQELTHRISWILHYGKIPDGLNVLHHCDVRRCVNPDPGHLFLGTLADNNRDCREKGRHGYGHLPGEKNGRALLSESDVRDARKRFEKGMSVTELAKRFGISRPGMYNIVHRITWRSI